MARHSIPPTPENFAVWYTHASEQSPALSQMIRILEGNAQPFDEGRCQQLHDRFIAKKAEAPDVADVSEQLSTSLTQLTELTENATQETAKYDQSLGDFAEALEKVSVPDLDTALADMRDDTQSMRQLIEAMHLAFLTQRRDVKRLRADLHEANQDALTDVLTGVANRNAFNGYIDKQMIISCERGTPVSVVCVDIDHFKSVNDTHGHQMGDEALVMVAGKLSDSIGSAGMVARIGGEEFVVTLPGIDLERSVMLANHLRSLIERSSIPLPHGAELSVTASFGVATYAAGESHRCLLARADAALYDAKRDGRNCVRSRSKSEAPVAA